MGYAFAVLSQKKQFFNYLLKQVFGSRNGTSVYVSPINQQQYLVYDSYLEAVDNSSTLFCIIAIVLTLF
jgi:hypothetical protein